MLYELKNLKRIHGDQVILDIQHLDFQSEKIYSLTGANGAGKTTLLNILAFLDTGFEGEIVFRSNQVHYRKKELLSLRRQIVLLDQHPLLFTAPVWNNIEFGLRVRKVPAKERKEKVEQALELVGMQDFYKAQAQTLSGGETKRIALARALVVEPDVLLCDEPTANVDAQNQEIILDILERINRQDKMSIIFSTHSRSQVQRLAHQTITLESGRLTTIVGGNVFEAVVVKRNEAFTVCEITRQFQLSLATQTVPHTSGKFRLLIDANKMTVKSCKKRVSGKFCIQGKIIRLSLKNSHVHLVVDVGVKVTIAQLAVEYRKKPLFVEQEVTIYVPEEAITVDNEW